MSLGVRPSTPSSDLTPLGSPRDTNKKRAVATPAPLLRYDTLPGYVIVIMVIIFY